MVRWMLVERCRPDWSYVERLIEDLNQRLDEDATFLTEKLELGLWVRYLCYYCKWYYSASIDFERTIYEFLDPPVACFHPQRKDQLNKYNKYGLLFCCYDLIRERAAPIPIGSQALRNIDVVYVRLWSRPSSWLSLVNNQS